MAKFDHILGGSDERDRDVINSVLYSPLKINEVLLCGRWEINVAVRERDSDARADPPAFGDTADHVIALYLLRCELKQSVSEEHSVSWFKRFHRIYRLYKDGSRVGELPFRYP